MIDNYMLQALKRLAKHVVKQQLLRLLTPDLGMLQSSVVGLMFGHLAQLVHEGFETDALLNQLDRNI